MPLNKEIVESFFLIQIMSSALMILKYSTIQ